MTKEQNDSVGVRTPYERRCLDYALSIIYQQIVRRQQQIASLQKEVLDLQIACCTAVFQHQHEDRP